ncbi:hypothetical protein EDB81DRAFT_395861 [Dactylonectria macrodidyma]|uniref:FAS1 domain-containing protein n=1 Tax=Dactylonectria macrodidyma TaxID=307937 RepID=A0A9P9F715_9HYPO|nr:hypothetical protein EDB81DRAFT_395861 [Dactylonectria macrodidyma]
MKPLLLLSTLIALSAAKLPQQAPLKDQRPDRPHLNGHLPVMADSSDNAGKKDANNDGQPSVAIADVLGTQRSLTTFSSFARLHPSTEGLLANFDVNTTVLAPLNSAIEALPRKPWESPRDYSRLGPKAYSGDDGQERARQNLLHFVEAHLVVGNPWSENDKAETVLGKQLWWVEKDGKRIVMPDEVEVERVASQVANGEVWILKGVLNYESPQ